jgi:thymidylate synthase
LAGSKDLAFISYYIQRYEDDADGEEISGGYGPRLFNWKGLNQVAKVTELLRKKRDSRNAVIQLFDASDLDKGHKSIPCTGTLQFMLRNDALHMFTCMRSNDVFLGLPHDCFCFTMLQEILASHLGVKLGTYKHAVGSLHLYVRNKGDAQQFLDEGWQSTDEAMPPIPNGDPWPAIKSLLKAEGQIRTTGTFQSNILAGIDPYWADLILLLQVFRYKKSNETEQIKLLCGKVASKFYFPFIEKVLGEQS